MSQDEHSRRPGAMLVRQALVLSITLLAACGGGSKTAPSASTQSQCEAAVRDLGLGTLRPPYNEAERDAQVALVSKSLASWETSRAAITVPGVRDRAVAIAAALTERENLLGAKATDKAAEAALDDNMHKYFAAIGELAGYCAEHH